MIKNMKQVLQEKAEDERRRCREWLLRFMVSNRPKFLTEVELRHAAMQKLKVSKNALDYAWIGAIEKTGRHDRYEPLRSRLRTRD